MRNWEWRRIGSNRLLQTIFLIKTLFEVFPIILIIHVGRFHTWPI
jgi:hypothetical protein